MNFRSLAIGCVLGFLAALVPACGGEEDCGGCIGSDGKCVPLTASSSKAACGKDGDTCAVCTDDQACDLSSRVCVSATGGGAGGGTGGGATGGGTGGGATGGGTGGGSTGGGTGGAGGGGPVRDSCNMTVGACPTASEVCFLTNSGSGFGECFPGACHLVPSDCPTATHNCYVGSDGTGGVTLCQPEGAVDIGGGCANAAACRRGLTCVNEKCTEWCRTAADCSNDGGCSGLITITGGAEQISAFACIYPEGCSVFDQDCPTGGQACYFSDTNGNTVCAAPGSTAIDAGCQGILNECVPGAMCIGPSPTELRCTQLCNPDGGAPNCATGACQLVQGAVHACQ